MLFTNTLGDGFQGHFSGPSEGAKGDRRISKYEMLRFAQHDKKTINMEGGHCPPILLKAYIAIKSLFYRAISE
jgi:hypothetical protein